MWLDLCLTLLSTLQMHMRQGGEDEDVGVADLERSSHVRTTALTPSGNSLSWQLFSPDMAVTCFMWRPHNARADIRLEGIQFLAHKYLSVRERQDRREKMGRRTDKFGGRGISTSCRPKCLHWYLAYWYVSGCSAVILSESESATELTSERDEMKWVEKKFLGGESKSIIFPYQTKKQITHDTRETRARKS